MFFEHTGDAAFAGITKEHFYDWSLTTTLKNSGLEPKTAAAKSAELRPFWEQHFFSPEAVLWDDALPGAAEWVRHLHATGALIVYLTGRTENIRSHTETALKNHDFPYDGCTLMMKPNAEMVDHVFKENALERIAEMGQVRLGIDNEPIQINHLADRFPDALAIWMDTDHSPRPIQARPSLSKLDGFLYTKKAPSKG